MYFLAFSNDFNACSGIYTTGFDSFRLGRIIFLFLAKLGCLPIKVVESFCGNSSGLEMLGRLNI